MDWFLHDNGLRHERVKYIDVVIITETKLDDIFITSRFLVKGFSVPSRLDRNRGGCENYDLHSR